MNKENEHPPVTMISTQPNSGPDHQFLSNGGNESAAMIQAAQQYYPPASAKPVTFGGNGAIHAPRHSFTKRSFGRDLLNIQPGTEQPMAYSSALGKTSSNLFNMQNKVIDRQLKLP